MNLEFKISLSVRVHERPYLLQIAFKTNDGSFKVEEFSFKRSIDAIQAQMDLYYDYVNDRENFGRYLAEFKKEHQRKIENVFMLDY